MQRADNYLHTRRAISRFPSLTSPPREFDEFSEGFIYLLWRGTEAGGAERDVEQPRTTQLKAMAALAGQPTTGPKERNHLGASSNSIGGGGVVQAAASQETANNGEGEAVYTCRLCRRVVFAKRDIQDHETATHSFHRRKVRLRECGVAAFSLCVNCS